MNNRPIRSNRDIREFLVIYPKAKTYKTRMNCYMSREVSVIFMQMHDKKGIELFGEKAIAAIFKEFKKLNFGSV